MSEHSNVTFIAIPGGSINGTIRVPGDKSISHRSIMLGALADGVTEVTGFLTGEDSLATLKAFQEMGVSISEPVDNKIIINGVGIDGLQKPAKDLYLGNSGTSMRLLSGLLSAQKFDVTLTGDGSLSTRPMKRVTSPLAEMGAEIHSSATGTAPLKIVGGTDLNGFHYDMPIASAQVKSCLLLAGMFANGETSVCEPAPTRDHTERMLKGFNYAIDDESAIFSENGKIRIRGGGRLTSTNIDVPADISSAAFFIVAASIAKDSDVLLEHVGINPTRTGVIDILRLMGADITLENSSVVGGEPIADIRVRSAQLNGISIPEELVPLAIDEFPVIFIAAACAQGTTILTGAEELRVKESDRIQVMVDGLKELSIDITATPDGAIIEGGTITGGRVHSHEDHRISMSFVIASLAATERIIIDDCSNVATSFPGFIAMAKKVGINVTEKRV